MDAAALDESEPVAGESPYSRYHQQRLLIIDDKIMTRRTTIRQLFYHPSLPYTLGSLFALGPIFVSSRFNKVERLKDIQGVYSGVSILSVSFNLRV